MVSTLGPKQSDIRHIDTITSNDFASNNLGQHIFSPNLHLKKQNTNLARAGQVNKFEPRPTVPPRRKLQFEPATSMYQPTQLREVNEAKAWTEPHENQTLIEVTSVPEVRVDLKSEHQQPIYQFENKYIKNVSSLKNSSILMKVAKPQEIQTQTGFRRTPHKRVLSPTNNTTGAYGPRRDLFSRTMPEGFMPGRNPSRASGQRSIDTDSRVSSRSRRVHPAPRASTSHGQSHPRNKTVSSYEQASHSREKHKGSSLPKSVRFLDQISISGDPKRARTTSIKSILKNASPKHQPGRVNLKPKNEAYVLMDSPGRHSSTPQLRKYVARNSVPTQKMREIGRKILNQNISRISERNESSKMTESKLSGGRNSSRFQTVIPFDTIQKVTQSPAKSKGAGKVVVLNDSRLSNSFRKISGNALISNSVKRIRHERQSRLQSSMRNLKGQTPTSMLSSSRKIVKPSIFARSTNKENEPRRRPASGNVFRNTVVSPPGNRVIEFKQSFGLGNVQQTEYRPSKAVARTGGLGGARGGPFKSSVNRKIENRKLMSKLKKTRAFGADSGRDSW